MGTETAIEWTESTWNPVRGCSRVSPGCGGPNHEGGCYAEKIAARFSGPGQPFEGFAKRTKHGGVWTGKMALIDDMLTVPLRWKKPRRIFVNSMSDLFHESLPDEAIDKVFAVMALAPQHTFQVLTKRAARMRAYLSARHGRGDGAICKAINDIPANMGNRRGALEMPLPNVWLGVSVEDQERADERIPILLSIPAKVRFLSCEPLLELVRIKDAWLIELDWIICGGESGHGARPMHPDWARLLRHRCALTGIPFFFKQWGEYRCDYDRDRDDPHQMHCSENCHEAGQWLNLAGGQGFHGERVHYARRIGKKLAGALLDGREHKEFPA